MQRTLVGATLSIASLITSASDLPHHHNPGYQVAGEGHTACSVVLSASGADKARLDAWAAGFITGVNIYSKVARPDKFSPTKKVVGVLEDDIVNAYGVRGEFIRSWCFGHLSNYYDEALTAWVEHILSATPR